MTDIGVSRMTRSAIVDAGPGLTVTLLPARAVSIATILAPLVAIAASAPAPTVQVSAPTARSIGAPAAGLTLVGLAPALATSGVSVAPARVTIGSVVPVPSLAQVTGSAIAAASVTVSSTSPAPALGAGGVMIAPPALTAVASVAVPAVATAAVGIVTAPLTLAFSAPAPAITVPAVAAAYIPYGTPIVTIGPSIQNVTSMRAPRQWLMFHASGHLRPMPGTNQATGGATATYEGAQKQGTPNNFYEETTRRLPAIMYQLGNPAARGKVLVQYDPGPNDFADIAANGTTTYGVTSQKLIDAMDRWIARVTGAGHMIAVCAIAISDTTSGANTFAAAARNAFNAAAAARHNPAAGIFYCGSRLQAFDQYSAGGQSWINLTYDGTLHPNARGADLIGLADYQDLAPYFGAGSALRETGSAPFGYVSNTFWNMPGTSGTFLTTNVTGQVADSWQAAVAISATSPTTAAPGLTATATKGTRARTVNGQALTMPAQIIEVTGTPTATSYTVLRVQVPRGTGSGQYFYAGESAHLVLGVEFEGIAQADPVGLYGIGMTASALGAAMSANLDSNTGPMLKSRKGALIITPSVSISRGTAQYATMVIVHAANQPVDLRLAIYSLDGWMTETVAYGAPWNLSAPFLGTNNNPLTRRPALTGSVAVSGTANLTAPTVAGGGLSHTFDIQDASNVTIVTRAQIDVQTYVWQAADSGKTVRMRDAASNSYGSLTIDDGFTSVVT